MFVKDLAELSDCSRAPSAMRAGVRSGVCLPLLVDGKVVGTMDFFALKGVEMSEGRIEILRTLGILASDKIENLGRQADMFRINRIIENAPLNMMYADLDLNIQYMNASSIKTLRRLEHLLPVKVEEMIGKSIDVFHNQPEHQRRMLADHKRLPHEAVIRLGPEYLNLLVSPIYDQKGVYQGPMLTWEVVTERQLLKAREEETAVDTAALNTLLVALGKAKTRSEAVSSALASISESYHVRYATYFELDPAERVLKFSTDSGSPGEEFRRISREATYREGDGLNGQAWRSREAFVSADLSELRGCPRSSAAIRNGLLAAISVPLFVDGSFVGTLDFFHEHKLELSANRQDTVRNIGRLTSTALERINQQVLIDSSKRDLEAKVSALMKVTQAAAAGDLTSKVTVAGDDDMGKLGAALAQMISDLKSIISQIIETASQFAEGSRVVSESASYLSESSQTQAATVEEMSAAIEHLSKAIAEINHNSSSARELALKTSQLAKQGESRSIRRSRRWC